MINWLHSRLNNPRLGWDPISPSYARSYERESLADHALVGHFANVVGGLEGKRIADLGSGPGHFSLEFARLGARVTCVDVSRTYLDMAAARLGAEGFEARYALGYMDAINRITDANFDGIFSNVSWNYCMNDFFFARQLARALRAGGVLLVRETNESFETSHSVGRRLVYGLNRSCGWKIGHPHPPRGRIAEALIRAGCQVDVDYSNPIVDLVVGRKSSISA